MWTELEAIKLEFFLVVSIILLALLGMWFRRLADRVSWSRLKHAVLEYLNQVTSCKSSAESFVLSKLDALGTFFRNLFELKGSKFLCIIYTPDD